MVKTTIVHPIYEDADGNLYRKVKQSEAIKDLDAVRERVDAKDGGEDGIRWLKLIGTRLGSAAEQDRVDVLSRTKVANNGQ